MNRFIRFQSVLSQMGSMRFTVPVFLTFIIATTEMATAIYAPCLPIVAEYFQITESQVQGTMGINLLGLSLSGLFYGPLSDYRGRRYALLLGIGLFLLGSLGCLFASSFTALMGTRFLQGLGAGVSVVVSFAVIQDLFDEKGSALVLSFMGMAISLSPGLAPILGGYLASNYGWRMCFIVVCIAAVLILTLLGTMMPETLKQRTSDFSSASILRAYWNGLKNKSFVQAALVPSLIIGGLWAWMTTSPILFINYLGVPLEFYGYYGFSAVCMYMIGTVLNGRLIQYISLARMVLVGLSFCLASSIGLGIAGYGGVESPVLYLIMHLPFSLGLSFILPNGTALAFGEVKEDLGTCSALLGSLEMIFGALCVSIMGKIFNGTIFPIAFLMGSVSFMALVCFYQNEKRKR